MPNESGITRRAWMASAIALPAAAAWPEQYRRPVLRYLESLLRPEGGYGWEWDDDAQLTPTFAVAGCYRLLGVPVPNRERVGAFVRDNYPVPPLRRTERPLWRFDYEQAQTLTWLDMPLDSLRPLAAKWTRPAEFTTRYELGGNPVFQHQACALRTRKLIGIPNQEAEWKEYVLARRRPNGSFNTTPASDGTDGHVMNTLWGAWALDSLSLPFTGRRELIAWLQACQLPSGGFTWQPGAKIAAVDDVCYTWAAVRCLREFREGPKDRAACVEYLLSLQQPNGGWQDREHGFANPLATYYALDALDALGQAPRKAARRAPGAARHQPPAGWGVFTAQVEAPGKGSPEDAVTLARDLGIHLWASKNSTPEWLAEAQRIAGDRKVAVTFAVGDEEYGNYVSLPGLGAYSHLADILAPAGRDIGARMIEKDKAFRWDEFKAGRNAPLRAAGGRLVWQFNENEEFTRILLDEACQTGTYAAVSSFHFGNENFLHSQPFLHRWFGRLAIVGLQDDHSREPWWWGTQLTGFRTLFIAPRPTWDGFLEALERQFVMAVRHDHITGWKTRLAGGAPEVRQFILGRQDEWRWWTAKPNVTKRPIAGFAVLRPGMKFEAGTPQSGVSLRLRLLADNTGQGLPQEPRVELVSLSVDGARANAQPVEVKDDRGRVTDRYHLLRQAPASPGKHTAMARLRVIDSREERDITFEWEEK